MQHDELMEAQAHSSGSGNDTNAEMNDFGLNGLSAGNCGALLICILAVLLFRYKNQQNLFKEGKRQSGARGTPPTVPYIFPLLGTLPLNYLAGPIRFVLNQSSFFQYKDPVRVKILHYDFYVVQGVENIKAIFKQSWACTSIISTKFALSYAFGLPKKALQLFDKDDSGAGLTPHADSTVEPRNRIDFLDHQSLVKFLEGKGLRPFWNRFMNDITNRFHDLDECLGDETKHYPDLMDLVRNEVATSIMNSLCGPFLLKLNPNFLHDYWVFDRNLQTYLQGTPWFLAPRAYASRKRVLNAVKAWHDHARENFTEALIGPDGDDPLWGSSFFRERQEMYLAMDGYDHDAVVSHDFGAIWATRNAIESSSWAVFDIYRDPELLMQVRKEVDSCITSGADERLTFDTEELFRRPVLQAVYAETLRLRMHFYIIRMPDRVDLQIADYTIPKRNVTVSSTTVAHMDPEAWKTGNNNEHDLQSFWAGRFLTYPEKDSNKPKGDHSDGPVFSTKGLEGSWIPYGGGPRQCPGRHFAKRQILLSIAIMVTLFDCEISDEGKRMKEDLSLKGFGGGVSHPAGPVPFKLRRRARQET